MSHRFRGIEYMDEDEPEDFEFHHSPNKKFKPPKEEYQPRKSRDREDFYRRENDYDDDR